MINKDNLKTVTDNKSYVNKDKKEILLTTHTVTVLNDLENFFKFSTNEEKNDLIPLLEDDNKYYSLDSIYKSNKSNKSNKLNHNNKKVKNNKNDILNYVNKSIKHEIEPIKNDIQVLNQIINKLTLILETTILKNNEEKKDEEKYSSSDFSSSFKTF